MQYQVVGADCLLRYGYIACAMVITELSGDLSWLGYLTARDRYA